ncbi:MAG TPA: selenoneine synthase SenA [Chloroflexota bacterium]|nr:selenoneine synthase SenA [Chloroflexota bacterium]
MITTDTIAAWVYAARERAIELIQDLSEAQLLGTRRPYVQPMKWESGHAAWFVENRVLERALGEPPFLPNGKDLYDSTTVPHRVRWELPLPDKTGTLQYLRDVRDQVLDRLSRNEASERLRYYTLYALFHEDMHNEALTYTRQTLAYPAPLLSTERVAATDAGPLPGDVGVPGGTFLLGATPDAPFTFDNEMWAHPVEVQPFTIARAPVTQVEFAAFVDDGGYRRRELWTEEGWEWREAEQAEHPRYWRQGDVRWERRDFDRWVPLEPHRPVINVNWFEADAYCRWAGRRLPTEVEWEVAAAGEPTADGRRLAPTKRRYPWGDSPPTPERANLDWRAMGCLDVASFPAGDSAFGCRQMAGNVWEWTSTDFQPYPGFRADEPYPEYSEPWFGPRKVLRGGCWATPSRLMWNTWRNFYPRDRTNAWSGFRTCALRGDGNGIADAGAPKAWGRSPGR